MLSTLLPPAPATALPAPHPSATQNRLAATVAAYIGPVHGPRFAQNVHLAIGNADYCFGCRADWPAAVEQVISIAEAQLSA